MIRRNLSSDSRISTDSAYISRAVWKSLMPSASTAVVVYILSSGETETGKMRKRRMERRRQTNQQKKNKKAKLRQTDTQKKQRRKEIE